MGKYRKILLAADLIEENDNPVSARALEIAKENGADLSAIHAVDHPPSYGDAFEAPAIANWHEELVESAKSRLAKLGEKLQIPEEKQHLRIGQPGYQILELAEEMGVDLIIVGSHARHGLGRFILGSTANSVLQSSKCDVLAVRV